MARPRISFAAWNPTFFNHEHIVILPYKSNTGPKTLQNTPKLTTPSVLRQRPMALPPLVQAFRTYVGNGAS